MNLQEFWKQFLVFSVYRFSRSVSIPRVVYYDPEIQTNTDLTFYCLMWQMRKKNGDNFNLLLQCITSASVPVWQWKI